MTAYSYFALAYKAMICYLVAACAALFYSLWAAYGTDLSNTLYLLPWVAMSAPKIPFTFTVALYESGYNYIYAGALFVFGAVFIALLALSILIPRFLQRKNP